MSLNIVPEPSAARISHQRSQSPLLAPKPCFGIRRQAAIRSLRTWPWLQCCPILSPEKRPSR